MRVLRVCCSHSLLAFSHARVLSQVAFLGCAVYGLPLARAAKEKGLSSIYVGGIIQLLFGITGRRYLEKQNLNGVWVSKYADEVFHDNVNEHWMPPLDSETPSNFRMQEGGAYWR